MASKNGKATQPIKMVIADVDGTLVTQEKVLTKRAGEAVQRLHEAGIQFSITSGRPPRGMAMLIDALKLTQPLAAFNGGVLIKPDLKTVVDQKFLPVGVPEKVIEAIESHGLDVWLYTDTEWFVRDRPRLKVVETGITRELLASPYARATLRSGKRSAMHRRC